MSKEAEVTGSWQSTEDGQSYEARAVSATGRVLGIVRVDIPVFEGIELAKTHGNEVTHETIEQAAQDLAGRFLSETP